MSVQSKRTAHNAMWLLPIVVLPQLVASLLIRLSIGLPSDIGPSELDWVPVLWHSATICCVVFVLASRNYEPLSPRHYAFWLAESAVLYGATMLLTYRAPLRTIGASLGIYLLFLMSIQVVALSHRLMRTRISSDNVVMGAIGYGFLLPFLCAMLLSLDLREQTPTRLLFPLAIGLLGLGVFFCGKYLIAVLTDNHILSAPDLSSTDAGSLAKPRFYDRTAFLAVFALFMPVFGLILAQRVPILSIDASSPAFYLIAIVGGLLAMPFAQKRYSPLFLYLQSAVLPFYLYFTVIMLPFTFIGLVVLSALVGLLFYDPAILLVISVRQMVHQFRALRARHASATLLCIIIVGLATLPAMLGMDFLIDRHNYHRAIQLVDQPDAAASIDLNRLRHTMNHMNDPVTPDRHYPFISKLYGRMMFGDAPIRASDVLPLHTAYFATAKPGVELPDLSAWSLTPRGYSLLSLTARTEFDPKSQVYLSWIDLDIKRTTYNSSREFTVQFTVPESAFVVDYYLLVGDEVKPGLLSERYASETIYQQIVRESLDPGLLTYQPNGDLQLKVFPFESEQVRKTGFCLMHTAPFDLNIAGRTLSIAAPERPDLHAAADMAGHGWACTARSCAERLPAQANAYDNAAVLLHNARIAQGHALDLVAESFRQHVLTPSTAFIVLETAEQEQMLYNLQDAIMRGEMPDKTYVSMDEPGWILLALVALGLLLRARHRRRPA